MLLCYRRGRSSQEAANTTWSPATWRKSEHSKPTPFPGCPPRSKRGRQACPVQLPNKQLTFSRKAYTNATPHQTQNRLGPLVSSGGAEAAQRPTSGCHDGSASDAQRRSQRPPQGSHHPICDQRTPPTHKGCRLWGSRTHPSERCRFGPKARSSSVAPTSRPAGTRPLGTRRPLELRSKTGERKRSW